MDFLQLSVDQFTGLKNLIEAIHELEEDNPAKRTPPPVAEQIFTPNVGDTKESHQERVVRYADECGSDAKAAKAFGIDDFRTIRQWRKDLAQ